MAKIPNPGDIIFYNGEFWKVTSTSYKGAKFYSITVNSIKHIFFNKIIDAQDCRHAVQIVEPGSDQEKALMVLYGGPTLPKP